MTPPIVRTVAAIRAAVSAWRAAGADVGLVPTMGALHAGHLSLVDAARVGCDRVVVSIFVNPAQFESGSDLAAYPRTEAADAALLGTRADMVFAPLLEEVYPPGFDTTVHAGALARRWEGAHRPGHFDGVATVVTKLFGMVQPIRAYFGEKDWQQLQVVRRLTRDLDLPVEVRGCPVARASDGLALSSRNARLMPEDRARAPALHRALRDAAGAISTGSDVKATLGSARERVLAAGFQNVDYLALCDEETLEPATTMTRASRLIVAATLGGVRLIDTISL